MRFITLTILILLSPTLIALSQENAQPITAVEALKKIDQKVTVQMEVKSTGGNTARFLNSEVDFRSEKNFAVFIPNVALAAFQKANGADPGEYYREKTIVVTGTVTLAQNRPQMRVEDPKQIKVVDRATVPGAKRAAK